MNKKWLPILILLSAISVSASAAFYSIYGLSNLFAGASTQVMIMASSLEISKLIIATLLHEYWNRLYTLLRVYLVIAVGVLMIITSIGIYGFLSAAYQKTANIDAIDGRKISVIDMKIKQFSDLKTDLNTEYTTIVQSINNLRTSLATTNSTSTNLEYRNANSSRKAFERQLGDAIARRDLISSKIQNYSDSLASLEIEKIELITQSEASSELGPLKYISSVSGWSMDAVVNILLLIIIFVFDPLAIALVIAANFAFKQLQTKNNSTESNLTDNTPTNLDNILQFNIPIEPEVIETETNIVDSNPDVLSENLVETVEKQDVKQDSLTEKKRLLINNPDIGLSPSQIRNMSAQAIQKYLETVQRKTK